MGKVSIWLVSVVAALGALLGCAPQEPEQPLRYSDTPAAGGQPIYRLAIHPLYNPHKLVDLYQPLVNYLNSRVPEVRFEVEASRDYAAYEEKIRRSEPAFLLPNPVQTLLAQQSGYRVVAMAGDPQDFKGIFIVRKDSNIRTPADLKGKTVSYPSPTALAAAIMPQSFLQSKGINLQTDIHNQYVGSQESAILNTYMGNSSAAATWPPPWRVFQKDYPEEAAQLMQIWETPPLINNSVMVHADVPVPLRDKVQSLLTGLNKTPEGKKLLQALETSAFTAADDRTYEVVRTYLDRFEKTVRPVKLSAP
ncbi:MAG: phosphate/phosphite/phosphonate ABC transporter substrate-binding protein [Rhodoferax sp.]|uniref:phosphate/phosphite/phosphonate ABC transporter substrate-binding protein n=1 Tax=Rhodoferax sp. TaxID=50421 RepID=UPI002ACD44E3|nr:phosphate/phosphite/phosphonate ABC transporter substrate-binding protein [Rhodoferax sp.]MDZ7891801.1 phosphate/phosphite/phosphonate ABC transporter substrate-binding protein [Rhodoferax sp.]